MSLISDETIHYDRYESHKQPLRVFNDFGAFLQAFGADLRVDSFPTFCLCMDPDATNLIPRMLRAIDSLGLKAEVMSGDDGL